ncbi:MAG: DUF4013 domain-containing protein [Rubripirellula sp.]
MADSRTTADTNEPVVARLADEVLSPPPPSLADPSEPVIARLLSEPEPIDPPPAPVSSQPVADPSVTSVPSLAEEAVTSADQPRVGFFRRVGRFVVWMIWGSFCLASLIVLLAVITAIPIVQLVAFGYLLSVAGGLAGGAKFRDSLPHLREAGQIGAVAIAVLIAALPTQLLAHWESLSYWINPGSGQATAMRLLAIAIATFATVYLLWAWVRGGRLRHYLWPQPKRFLREGWRWSTWKDVPDRLWEFTASLELPKYFWLGVRGAAGTLVWLIPAMIIIPAFRQGETGLAGLVGFVSVFFLGVGMLYLPMLQAHFAREDHFAALFEVRKIRGSFRRAPWAWLTAMVISLVLTPIPLYLLKIEATPREVMWLPCLVFVAFILPARIAAGLALRRAARRPEPSGKWAACSRWFVRFAMLGVVGIYLVFLYVSQYTSWDGLASWVQQHAILIPVPFSSGT